MGYSGAHLKTKSRVRLPLILKINFIFRMIKVGGGGVQGPVFLTFFYCICNSAGLVKLNKNCCLMTVVRIIFSTEALSTFDLIILSGFIVVGCWRNLVPKSRKQFKEPVSRNISFVLAHKYIIINLRIDHCWFFKVPKMFLH